MRSSVFYLTLTVCLLGGCGQETHSNLTEFQRPQSESTREYPFTLSRAEGLDYRVSETQLKGRAYPFDRFSYTVTFGPLTIKQFAYLKQTYGGWSRATSAVTYNPGQTYTLQDFLPPLMQATMDLSFVSQNYVAKLPRLAFPEDNMSSDKETSLSTIANCWGETYEVIRSALNGKNQSFQIFYAPYKAIKDFLTESSYSNVVQEFSTDASHFADEKRRNQGLQPGDVLIIGQRWLMHTAIFIDNDLFFEKSGSGDKTLYRLVPYNTLKTVWDPTLYGWSYRRFGKKPLPEPSKLFSLQTLLKDWSSLNRIPSEVRSKLTPEFKVEEDSEVISDVYLFPITSIDINQSKITKRYEVGPEFFSPDSLNKQLPQWVRDKL